MADIKAEQQDVGPQNEPSEDITSLEEVQELGKEDAMEPTTEPGDSLEEDIGSQDEQNQQNDGDTGSVDEQKQRSEPECVPPSAEVQDEGDINEVLTPLPSQSEEGAKDELDEATTTEAQTSLPNLSKEDDKQKVNEASTVKETSQEEQKPLEEGSNNTTGGETSDVDGNKSGEKVDTSPPDKDSEIPPLAEDTRKEGGAEGEEDSDDGSFATAEDAEGEELSESDEEGVKEPQRRQRGRQDDSELSEEDIEGEGEGGEREGEVEGGEREEEGQREDREGEDNAVGDDDAGQSEGGEGEEWAENAKEGDLEEDDSRTGPMHVPTTGVYFQHDNRLGEDNEEPQPAPEVEKTRADTVEKWGHDLYVEEEQKPREDWEKEKAATYWAERESRGDSRGGGRSRRGPNLGNFMKDGDRERFNSYHGGRGGRGRRGRGGGGRGGRGGNRGRYRDRGNDDDDGNEERRDNSGDRYDKESGEERRRGRYNRDRGGDRDGDRWERGRGRRGGRGYGRYRDGGEGRERGRGRSEDWDGDQRDGERQDRRGQGRDRDDRRYRDKDQRFSERSPRERGRQWGGKDGTPPNHRGEDGDQSRERGQKREWGGQGQRRDRGDRRRRDDWNARDGDRGHSKSQVASETGTEDWGEADDWGEAEDSNKQQGSSTNWSNATNQEQDNKTQSPKISNNAQGGGEGETPSPTAKPTQASLSSSGIGGEQQKDMTFSRSRNSDLVTRYTSKRGKSRGRGQRSSGGPSRVGGVNNNLTTNTTPTKARYAPPKPGSGGITVIEPLEKRLQEQQQDNLEKSGVSDGQLVQGSPSSARPSSTSAKASDSGGDTAESANKGGGKNRPGSGHSSSSTNKDGQPATMSKPKRYSSQRQKGEGGEQQSISQQPPPSQHQPLLPPPHPQQPAELPPPGQWHGAGVPPPPGGPGGPIPGAAMPPLPPMDPAAYQDFMDQQGKWLEMAAASSGTDLMALQSLLFQNPVLLQQQQQQQQYVWQQMAQQQAFHPGAASEGPPGGVPPPPPPGDGSLLGFPPQLPRMPLPGGLEQDAHYTSPSGLFIPSIPPEQQRRQQSLQKPRSQAIPIVSPTHEEAK